MKPAELKAARIGNSRRVRMPAAPLDRYRIGARVVIAERSDRILLRPRRPASPKLSWEETAGEVAAAAEDWEPWDAAAADGLEDIPWGSGRPGRVAEREPRRETRRRSPKR